MSASNTEQKAPSEKESFQNSNRPESDFRKSASGEGKSNGDNQGAGGPMNDPHNTQQTIITTFFWILVISSILHFTNALQESEQVRIGYSEFKAELRADNVASAVISDRDIKGEMRSERSIGEGTSSKNYIEFKTFLPPFEDRDLLYLLEENEVIFEVLDSSSPTWVTIFLNTAPWLILLAFFVYSGRLMRRNLSGGMGAFGFSKSRARQYEASSIETGYKDVAGLENAKRDLEEVVDYLKNPEIYQAMGAKIPKGILMMGPPGCGKTLLARATAGEAGVPFFSVSGSEFIEMFVGVGASRVRDMFENARKCAPALIFIDEIDSVGRVRGTGMGGGNDEREQTLNQILAEMDGFSSDEAVVVLAATNRPDVLDPALLRPGRFDRKLVLELPGRKARVEIVGIHTRKVPLADDVDIERIAGETVGFSGADIENLVNEAALMATRERTDKVSQHHFEAARDKVVMGSPLNELLSEAEKRRVAYHEAGHALITYLSDNADPINKVSIIPRGRALGATEQLPLEDRHNYTQDYLEEKIRIMLGGRCAEKLKFGLYSSGAADDLKQVTQLAKRMVTQWGMSERLGAMNLQQNEEHPFLGREIAEPKQFSEHSARAIDEEVGALINRCEASCYATLEKQYSELNQLAEALLEHENLTGDEIKKLLGDEQKG